MVQPGIAPSTERLLAQRPAVALAEERALLDEVRARLFGIGRTSWHIGRYQVRGTLGAGAGGTVLRAYDPQLGREVAIKLLHAREPGAHDQAWVAEARLLQEARALGRLAHPNVVAVYDVGRLVDSGVYMVMELVAGEDLAHWLAAPRSTTEILATFTAAGRGLAAAHALGLLHRDFKPHNVLVGHDGRVRVADFGLSLARARQRVSTEPQAGPLLSLTTSGAVVGTPLYMAPEQHRGQALDHRCDQYAFCFALREALWGRPALDDLDAVLAFKLEPPLLPARPGLSARAIRAIERGLQPDPAARWPSMTALLAALARPPRSRAWMIAALATGAIAASTMASATPTEPAGPCATDDPGWSSVWGAEPRAAVHDAFSRDAAVLADETLAAVDARMDALGRGWTDARTHACADPDAAVLACLQQQRSAARALVLLWRDGGNATVQRAIAAALALDEPSTCVRPAGAAVSPPPDEDAIAIDALVAAGHTAEAAARATTVSTRLDDEAPATTATLALSVGRALAEAGDFELAASSLARGYDAAQAIDDPVASVQAAALLVTVVGTQLGRAEDGDTWARHGAAALTRAGEPAALRAVLERHLGHAAGARGQWSRAREHYLADAAAELAASGDDSLAHARALDNVANAQLHLGEPHPAIAGYERVLAIKRPLLGAHHPDVATTLHNLASASLQIGELEAAEQHARAALAIWRAVLGERSPDVALAHYTLGSILLARGEPEAAQVELQAALALRRALLGDEHPDTLGTMTNLANALDVVDRPDAALELLAAVVRVHDRPGTALPDRGVTLLNYGNMLRRTGRIREARDVHVRTIAVLAGELGDAHLASGIAWYSLAMDDRLLGELTLAGDELDGAIARLGGVLPEDHTRWIGVWHEQSRVLAALGQREPARVALGRALAIPRTPGDDEPDAELLRAELRALDEGAR